MTSGEGEASYNVSVTVVNWNGLAHLQKCMPSVVAEAGDQIEIILVDNASTDGSVEYVSQRFPQVRLVRNSMNRGYAGGSNDGWRNSRGEICIFLNNDVSLLPGFIRELAGVVGRLPKVGIAGAKLLYPDAVTIQHAGGVIRYPLLDARHRGYGEPDQGQYDELTDVDYVTSAAIAVKRSVLHELGGFDEGFNPLDYSETDLCWRARRLGYRVVFVPSAVAVHHESSTVSLKSPRRWRIYHRGRVRLALLHLPIHYILKEYVPAEEQRLARDEYCQEEREALRGAILDNLVQLASIVERRGSDPSLKSDAGEDRDAPYGRTVGRECGIAEPLERLAQALEGLRLSALRQHAHLMPGADAQVCVWRPDGGALEPVSTLEPALDDALESRAVLRPKPFVSSFPILGGAIAWFREQCNNVSTRWYLAPLIQQQSEYNLMVARQLRRLEQRPLEGQSALWESLSGVDRDLTMTTRQLGVLKHRLDRLQELVGQDRRARVTANDATESEKKAAEQMSEPETERP